MGDIEIMLILFHSSGFHRCKQYYKEYACKHLFLHQVLYNYFVEQDEEVLLSTD